MDHMMLYGPHSLFLEDGGQFMSDKLRKHGRGMFGVFLVWLSALGDFFLVVLTIASR